MLTIADFEKAFYGEAKRLGTDAQPLEIPLVVVAWEPKGKGEPPLSAVEIQELIFGPGDSLARWFEENSQGRYRIVPIPGCPVIGPVVSEHDWQFYWRTGPFATPLPGDPHYYKDQAGNAGYLDDAGFLSGFNHSYAEAIRIAANHPKVDFKQFDRNHDGKISIDECLVLVIKAQKKLDGFRRGWPDVCGQEVPLVELKVDGVTISDICEFYGSHLLGSDILAIVAEEVAHLATPLGDQYPDGNFRLKTDSRRPSQLALTDAEGRPVHIDPNTKLKSGWLRPQLADHTGAYTLKDAATTGDALILFSPYFGTDEFFILENRWRGSSFDRFRDASYGEGLALWHCIQDQSLQDPARTAIHLRRADPRVDPEDPAQNHLTLFDGSYPDRSYDLHDDSSPQNMRFRDGVPSRIRIRDISPAGPTMTVYVEVPPPKGARVGTDGHVRMLRVHERGTGYGSPAHRLQQDCIVTLDSEPGVAFGVDLTGPNASSGKRMFDRLHSALQKHSLVHVEYEAANATGGRVIRVSESRTP